MCVYRLPKCGSWQRELTRCRKSTAQSVPVTWAGKSIVPTNDPKCGKKDITSLNLKIYTQHDWKLPFLVVLRFRVCVDTYLPTRKTVHSVHDLSFLFILEDIHRIDDETTHWDVCKALYSSMYFYTRRGRFIRSFFSPFAFLTRRGPCFPLLYFIFIMCPQGNAEAFIIYCSTTSIPWNGIPVHPLLIHNLSWRTYAR